MTDKKDDNKAGWTGMSKPVFGINHNPFRSGDSLVDAVRAVLSGKPITQEQKAELDNENPPGASKKTQQEEEQVNVQEATLEEVRKYNASDVEEIAEVAMGFIKNKEFPGKEIAKKMKAMGRPMAGQAPKVAKMKKVTWRQLDLMLPDMIAGKDIAALFQEDASNDKSDDGKGLDKADPKAAKKKFKDRKDKDIDNDGDTDDSDKYLHKKRKAITKAVAKEVKEKSEAYANFTKKAPRNTILVVNPKDPKAKGGGGVVRIPKHEWDAYRADGWIMAEQAVLYIDPESKYIEVDFGPAEDLDDILVEGMMYERWSIPKAPQTNPNSGDNLVAWKHDFVDWLGELEPGAKFHIGFADSDTVGDYPDTGKRNVARYKFVTKVIGKKVAEVMKALEKVSTIK